MIIPFGDTNLTELMIKKILTSKVIPRENFYLSVYEKELVEIAEKYNVNVYHRSRESSFWDAGGAPLNICYEWWNKLPFTYCILISACAPFLKIETIDSFVQEYLDIDETGMFAVIPKKQYYWNDKFNFITEWPEEETSIGDEIKTTPYKVMNTKSVGITYEAAHCLYASKMDGLKDGIWMGDFNKPGDIKLVSVDEEEVFDIDYEWQFKMAEAKYIWLQDDFNIS